MDRYIIPDLALTPGLKRRLFHAGRNGRKLKVRQWGSGVYVSDYVDAEPTQEEKIEIESIVSAHRAEPF